MEDIRFAYSTITAEATPWLCIKRRSGVCRKTDSVKDLKGKRLAINTFGSSADFAIYQLLSRNGLDPNKDVTLLSIAGSPDARFACAARGLSRCNRGEQPVRISRRAKRF